MAHETNVLGQLVTLVGDVVDDVVDTTPPDDGYAFGDCCASVAEMCKALPRAPDTQQQNKADAPLGKQSFDALKCLAQLGLVPCVTMFRGMPAQMDAQQSPKA